MPSSKAGSSARTSALVHVSVDGLVKCGLPRLGVRAEDPAFELGIRQGGERPALLPRVVLVLSIRLAIGDEEEHAEQERESLVTGHLTPPAGAEVGVVAVVVVVGGG